MRREAARFPMLREAARFPMLRQQELIADDKPNGCLADFVAPAASGRRDDVGGFAVTAGPGADRLVAEFERDHDDDNASMVKALAGERKRPRNPR